MTRFTLNALFATACFAFAFTVSGCDGIGLPDATDEVYAAQVSADEDETAQTDLSGQQDDEEAPQDEQEAPQDEQEVPHDEDPADYTSECLFGTSVADLMQADWLSVGEFEHVDGADELTSLEKEQLLVGFADHGDEVDGIEELFERFVDDGRVMVRTVLDLDTEASYSHLAFWSQGREKGYLFIEDTLRLAAAVDGGTIYACVVGF